MATECEPNLCDQAMTQRGEMEKRDFEALDEQREEAPVAALNY